jgi:hypothetical protein
MSLDPEARTLRLGEEHSFEVNPLAHKQLATKLDVPTAFYERMQTKHPDILSDMVNALFTREPQKTMVRTLDGRARAIRSDGYRTLDNYDLFCAIQARPWNPAHSPKHACISSASARGSTASFRCRRAR